MSLLRPMLGHIVVELLIVDGPPGSPAAFTPKERLLVRQHAASALALLSRLARRFGDRGPVRVADVCTLELTVRTVPLSLDPALVPSTFFDEPHPETKSVRDAVWEAALVEALGYTAPATLVNYTADQRRFLRGQRRLGRPVADSAELIVTKYGCHWDGFQERGASEAAVLWLPPLLSKAPGLLGAIMAHEIGHVFDAPDEYGHCTVAEVVGFFDTPNTNCVLISQSPDVPNPGVRVPCLMDKVAPVACPFTELHWGWDDSDRDGVADLMKPCDFTLSDNHAVPRQTVTITGTNVWDARAVFFRSAFGSGRHAAIPRAQGPNKVKVDVPEGTDTWVLVEFDTRVGAATSASPSLFVDAVTPPASTGPIVWGVLPVFVIVPGANDLVRILGTGLSGPTEVTFGGVPADLSTIEPDSDSPFGNDEEIRIRVPAGVTGTVDVAVTTDSGMSQSFPPFSQVTCQ